MKKLFSIILTGLLLTACGGKLTADPVAHSETDG